MSFLTRTRSIAHACWPWLRIPFWICLGLLVGFVLPYTLVLNKRVQDRFNDLVFAVPTRVYARPLPLAAGTPMTSAALELELTFAGYSHDGNGEVAGSWTKEGLRYTIASRGYAGPDGGELPKRIRVTLGSGIVQRVQDLASDKSITLTHLDPARIATLYGASQEERRIVRLADVPPLLLSGLQAVEDRDFKHHIGIDFSAILRAAFANMRAGHTVQGGSTLTQQLVRNLFLSRDQNFARKINEALMSMLLEAHYDKGRILEAYVNDVFLGQQGDQAVHGFAAASEFYFGRRLEDLRPQEIALLVGMVKGPSYYDPRRSPERALTRRNLVLQEFATTGLLTAAQTNLAQSTPLDVISNGQLPHNRFPAFMELVRAQITADFDEQALRDGNLSIFTTLDPAAQLYTEQAITTALKDLGKRGSAVQAAAVVTGAQTGSVLAVVGSKIPGDQGFNRALDARRPIGSTIKPFVYLVALTQPDRWNLLSLLDDSPISMRQPDGSLWQPHNDDDQSHGQVPMVDSLAKSWNLASIRLGLAVGLPRIKSFLESFGLTDVNPSPSVLIGALDLAPIQVTQLYQYIAADGHALPLVAVRGVVDGNGRTIKRYQVQSGNGEYQGAVRLTTWAMKQVALYGTASAIGNSGLAWLHAAGKTGTSNDLRDGWFAGFTEQHLAVFWMGRDDNKPTGLFGATGALRAWRELFAKLPTQPLSAAPGDGLEMVTINPADGKRTEPQCQGARQVPVIVGTLSADTEGCFWQGVQNLFGGGPAGSISHGRYPRRHTRHTYPELNMLHRWLKHAPLLLLLMITTLLGACDLFGSRPPPPSPPPLPNYDRVAAIRAAGDRETSVIAVNALRDPGVTSLQDAAQQDERAGRYADAAGKLDQALKLSPDSPDLLQDRAEMAVRLKDYSGAEKFAHQSWTLGPKLGPLCARNWQTVVEMRLLARDKAGADSARRSVQECHKAGIPRY